MTSRIDTNKLFKYCRIPVSQLENHPDARARIRILETKDDVHRCIAQDMIDEVIKNNQENKSTHWILPCGPTKQYTYFVQWVNEKKISLKNVHIFHMDEFLDWQGRPIPSDHPFSFEGWMRKNLYDPIDESVNIPESQRHFPSVYDIDGISKMIQDVGGVDTTYGGIGYRGHIAFNEPPRSPWNSITLDEFKQSKTRIVILNEDTIIALSQRSAGGCSHIIPPMAITLGMKDLLSAKRMRLFSDTGSWKRTVIRYLIFGEPTIEYPVTLAQDHPDVIVIVDRDSVLPPLVD